MSRETSALIVVDVQNDFCEGGALGVTGGAAVAARIGSLATGGDYDHVVATRDVHVDPGPHFSATPDFVDSWPPHCRAGTPGASFHPALDVAPLECVFDKGAYASGYSGFEGTASSASGSRIGTASSASGSRIGTASDNESGVPLADWLDERGVREVHVAGLATDHCVRATALDAARLGLRTTVLLGHCAGVAPETTERALAQLREAGVTVAG